jgi:hypothetical protein
MQKYVPEQKYFLFTSQYPQLQPFFVTGALLFPREQNNASPVIPGLLRQDPQNFRQVFTFS